ncbi:MAG: hypothetical protein OXG47_10520 [bacterium]|nr:hypothetical protein [bacterium]
MHSLSLFLDENIAPLGQRLAAHPGAGLILWVGHPNLPSLPLGTNDSNLLKAVGETGRLFVTRDRHILTRPWERKQIYDAAVRLILITATGNHASWYELILRYWQRLSEIDADTSGLCIFQLNRSGVHESRLRRYPIAH